MMTDPDLKTGAMLEDAVIQQNLNTFLVAGHDSTSSAITMSSTNSPAIQTWKRRSTRRLCARSATLP